jgi:hypothetical protein
VTPADQSKTDLRRGRIRPQPTDRDEATTQAEEAFLFTASGPAPSENKTTDGTDDTDGNSAFVSSKPPDLI